jgi:hypothetical protein
MHNKVVYHAMKVLNDPTWGFGIPTLRFNFRSTGLSQGKHDGVAESGDVLAALAWLNHEYNRPIVVAGFSFGAAMSLAACCPPGTSDTAAARVCALACLGLPLSAEGRRYEYPFLESCSLPKFFLSGNRDEYAPAEELEQLIHQAHSPRRLALIEDADHFFTGRIEPMQKALAGWLQETLR